MFNLGMKLLVMKRVRLILWEQVVEGGKESKVRGEEEKNYMIC